MRTKTIRQTGIFLSSIFSFIFLYNIVDYHVRGEYLSSFRFAFSVSILGIMSGLLIFTVLKTNKFSMILHVCIVYLTGIITVIDTNNVLAVHGEIIIILGLLLSRAYGLTKKNLNISFSSLLILCIILRFIGGLYIRNDLQIVSFIPYIVLVVFLNMFFFIILNSAEEKTKDEARRICNLWQKEMVYTDIGKTVFSSFIHDYNVSDMVTGARTARTFLKRGEYEDVDEMLVAIEGMGNEDYKRINSVRGKVVMSCETTPHNIMVSDFISDIMSRLKTSQTWDYESVILKDDTDFDSCINILRIDFVGIVENFLRNSFEACEGSDAQIGLTIYNKGRNLVMEIWNTGPKIPWAGKDGSVSLQEFRPGRTTKKRGTGWGIYACIRRIQEHKGSLKITSDKKITRFITTFPVVQEVKHG